MDTHHGQASFSEPRRRSLDLIGLGPDARLAAIEFGDPDRPLDLIFLHANGFNAMTYRNLLAPLASTLRILAVDQQGHGHSPQRVPVEDRKSWMDLRDDLLALLETLDPGAVVLGGHSMGGAVSLFTAAARPDRVKALALFDPVIPSPEVVARMMSPEPMPPGANGLADGAERRRAVFPSREAVMDSYRGRGAFRTWPVAALADYILDGFRDRPDGQVELTCSPAWEASNFRSHGHDPWVSIAQLKTPTTLLRAEHASTCSLTDPAQLPADLAPKRVETIAGATHFLPIERPELAREVLLAACAG